MTRFSLFPEQASSVAGQVDAFLLFMIAVSLFFSALIAGLILVFMVRFRRRPGVDHVPDAHGSLVLEGLWTVIPFAITMVMFFWSASLYATLRRAPDDALSVHVVGKQWMWKLQHMEGRREINELHVPVGRPVELTMTSEDVIHSFFVPAFRVKQDVVPGRYTTAWFEATKPGTYHLFCAEYCGTLHSGMIGRIVAMEPADFERWLGGEAAGEANVPVAVAGENVFRTQACGTCHRVDGSGQGPSLAGVFGKQVSLASGETVVADEGYLRESILHPQARIVAGYQPVMPTYQGLVSEEDVMRLVAYVKSLQAGQGGIMSEPVDRPDYLNVDYGVRSWLLTVDHKRIAILYLVSVTIMFVLGGLFAAGIRLELLTPRGDVMQADTYNKLFTMHGIIMVFFFLIPSIPSVLGNFLIPLMIGARDLAFPRINLASWYLYVIGALFTLYAMITGGVDTGWTFYTPYSTASSATNVMPTAIGIFVTGFSSILTGLNFIATIHTMRAPGLTWFRLPLFVWAHYATSLIMVLGTPVLAITIALVGLERAFHIGIFDPALGGDPILFQHLFWFYSHPAVYIMILPGMGVISELVTCFARKRIYGYGFIAASSLLIALLGFLVWGHHLFVSGQSQYAALIFSFLSFFVAIPSAVKVFNWTATLYRGSIAWDSPMLYALGFIGLFTIGGLTGLFLASLGLDVHVHDTYFVVAHFHYIMVGGTIMAYLGGLHFWWPKITGRMYPEGLAKISGFVIFLGFNLTFFPQFVLGYLGMPRRYHAYPEEFQVLNVLSTAGASILGVGYLLPLCYFLWSLRYGAKAVANPWGAAGLEWTTPSPPPTENFATTPVVTTDAYEYGPDGARSATSDEVSLA